MDFKQIFAFIENEQTTPLFKHMTLLSALHTISKSNDLQNLKETISRLVNESLKLINVTVQSISNDENLHQLLHDFIITLSLYRSMIAYEIMPGETGEKLLQLAGKILHQTEPQGIEAILIGNIIHRVNEGDLKRMKRDDILYSDLYKIKVLYDDELKRQPFNQQQIIQKYAEMQYKIIYERLTEIKLQKGSKTSQNVDLNIKMAESYASALKMPSLSPYISQIVNLMRQTPVKSMATMWTKVLKDIGNELMKKMFVESKNRGELEVAIQINVFEAIGEEITEKYRKEYIVQDTTIQKLMDTFGNAVHPYHFRVEKAFILEERGIAAQPYSPVVETFKRIALAKYPYEKSLIGSTILDDINNIISGFFTRTGQKMEPLGADQLNPLYTYLLFKSKYEYLYSDGKMIEDFLDSGSEKDYRGYWVGVHMSCATMTLRLEEVQMNNSLLSSVLSNGEDATVLVIGMEGIGKTTLIHSLKMKKAKTTDPCCNGVCCGKLDFLEWDVHGDKTDCIPMQCCSNICGIVLCTPNIDEHSINTSFSVARFILESVPNPIPVLLLMTRHDLYPNVTLQNFPKLSNVPFKKISKIQYGLCSSHDNYGIYDSLMKLKK